jgi:NAD-dependent dihydropyrimidine dehydrogenase PreA subunit
MKVNVDKEKCTGCRRCYEVCPLDVYSWDEDEGKPVVVYEDECQMCFICQEECPAESVKISVPIIFW